MADKANIQELLGNIDLFSNLEKGEIRALTEIAVIDTHKEGKIVFRHGEASDHFRVVLSGSFEVYLWDEIFKVDRPLSNLKRGDVFGEMGFLTDEPRSAFVRSEGDGETLRFNKLDFFPLLEKHPKMIMALARTLAHRVSAANKAGGIKLENLARYKPVKEVIQLLPLQVILRYRLLPVSRADNQVTVAMVDPSDSVGRNTVTEFLKKYHLTWVCILQRDFENFRDKHLFDLVAPVKLEADSAAEITYLATNAAAGLEENSEAVRSLDNALHAAIDSGASDLHFEPGPQGVAVRGRIDGRLIELGPGVPHNTHKALVSRLKALSDLDITETRMPQESVLRLRYGSRNIDLRISLVPTPKGESIACRLFDPSQRKLDLQHLVLSERVCEMIRHLFFLPSGLVLVTGPTGSGKTTTLYSGIRERQHHQPSHKVVTAEDPIEYELNETTQVQVRPHLGLTYEKILRSLLHQDPDIILVGEIRDKSSMEIAVEAALTGHLVLSSLHTNDAFESVLRIRQRGIEPYAIAAALKGIISQRLVSRLCAVCAEESKIEGHVLAQLQACEIVGQGETPKVWNAPGCSHCRMTGRKGRVGVYEVLRITTALRDAIERGVTLREMRQAAPIGTFVPARAFGKFLMEKGLVAPEDLVTMFPSVKVGDAEEL